MIATNNVFTTTSMLEPWGSLSLEPVRAMNIAINSRDYIYIYVYIYKYIYTYIYIYIY